MRGGVYRNDFTRDVVKHRVLSARRGTARRSENLSPLSGFQLFCPDLRQNESKSPRTFRGTALPPVSQRDSPRLQVRAAERGL